jgi:hypothetical protein
VDLPESYFVGLTAHTGQVADNHDIYSLQTVSLEPQPPEPVPTQDAVEEEHQPHESESKAHEWRKDDDRHLQRFADAVQRWTELSEEAKERARRVRDEKDADPGGDEEEGKGGADAGGDEEEQQQRRGGEGEAAARESAEMVRFRDEVSSTLQLIQAEVKEIAHEMRGTITLAHAAPQSSSGGGDEEGAEGGGVGSASALVAELGEMLQQNKQALVRETIHEVSSASSILRSPFLSPSPPPVYAPPRSHASSPTGLTSKHFGRT